MNQILYWVRRVIARVVRQLQKNQVVVLCPGPSAPDSVARRTRSAHRRAAGARADLDAADVCTDDER